MRREIINGEREVDLGELLGQLLKDNSLQGTDVRLQQRILSQTTQQRLAQRAAQITKETTNINKNTPIIRYTKSNLHRLYR